MDVILKVKIRIRRYTCFQKVVAPSKVITVIAEVRKFSCL